MASAHAGAGVIIAGQVLKNYDEDEAKKLCWSIVQHESADRERHTKGTTYDNRSRSRMEFVFLACDIKVRYEDDVDWTAYDPQSLTKDFFYKDKSPSSKAF